MNAFRSLLYIKPDHFLPEIFITGDTRTFFIKSSCILSCDHTIKEGKYYLISGLPNVSGINQFPVKLLKVFMSELGILSLVLMDMLTHRTFKVKHRMQNNEISNWVLIDLEYFPKDNYLISIDKQAFADLLEFDY